MSGDLNDFLRQAALRREARKRQTGSPPSSTSSSQNVSSPSRPSAPLEVLQPIPVEQRHMTSHIPTGDHLSGNVEKVDQKRDAHLRDVFGNKPAPLERSQKKKAKPKSDQQPVKPPPSPSSTSNQAEMASSLQGRKLMSSADLLALLRNPDSLKMAFIASEIFGRKFQ